MICKNKKSEFFIFTISGTNQELSSKILKKFWMTMSGTAPNLSDKILKKFWMTMSRTAPNLSDKILKKILDDDERNEVTRKEKKNVKLHN